MSKASCRVARNTAQVEKREALRPESLGNKP